MPERAVTARWLGDYRVDVTAGEFDLRVDEPVSVGGDDTGPQPTDLLLASVSSCFVLSLAWAARKRGLVLESIAVSVTATYDGPRFSRIEIEVDLPGDVDQVEALIAAAERVCYVTNTLRRSPDIEVRRAPSR
jgi:putative redox protein